MFLDDGDARRVILRQGAPKDAAELVFRCLLTLGMEPALRVRVPERKLSFHLHMVVSWSFLQNGSRCHLLRSGTQTGEEPFRPRACCLSLSVLWASFRVMSRAFLWCSVFPVALTLPQCPHGQVP